MPKYSQPCFLHNWKLECFDIPPSIPFDYEHTHKNTDNPSFTKAHIFAAEPREAPGRLPVADGRDKRLYTKAEPAKGRHETTIKKTVASWKRFTSVPGIYGPVVAGLPARVKQHIAVDHVASAKTIVKVKTRPSQVENNV